MRPLAATLLLLCALGCATARGPARATPPPPAQEVRFEEQLIVADLALDRLNDEELFAGGSSALAAGDHRKAARYFGRIADFHPGSRHLRPALYNAGVAHQRLSEWEAARARFAALADPEHGTGEALDAAFRLAECDYHLGRYQDAAALLSVVASRPELPEATRIEALVQRGICEHELGASERAEATLRGALERYGRLGEQDGDLARFAAQAQFFLGELHRLRYEQVALDPEQDSDRLAAQLELKAQLLLSAQGHYLRAIRIGDGYWATAAGAQIGGLYENLYRHLVSAPAPRELGAEEVELYREEVRQKIRVLLTKAISIYERTLEAAERVGSEGPFVEKTRENLQRMKDLLVSDSLTEDPPPSGGGKAPPAPAPGPRS